VAKPAGEDVVRIELVFDSKFQGHGNEELWLINGKSYPHTDEPVLKAGQRYRLVLKNQSMDDHPLHLHRHTFQVRKIEDVDGLEGLRKDVVLVPAKSTAEVEFVADHPGRTLFHCHQQDHMDRGFMMVFRYA
jgi:FtsP/CotA-like multicopper oxidase with cupredoxin domain